MHVPKKREESRCIIIFDPTRDGKTPGLKRLAQDTNPVEQTVDEVGKLGQCFDLVIALVPSVAGALANHQIKSIWSLLILTAPFTVTVAFQTYRVMRGKIESVFGFGYSTVVLLIALSLVSQWIGIGAAIHVDQVIAQQGQLLAENYRNRHTSLNRVSLVYLFFVALLGAYFDLYQPVTFVASLVCGVYLGYRFAKAKEVRARIAAQRQKKAAGA